MKRGFTLIELLLVLAIIAALAAIILPSVVGWSDTSKESTTKGNVHTLKVAFEAYYLDNSAYPPENGGQDLEDALVALSGAAFGITNKDEYLKDAWGNKFVYDLSSSGKFYIIWTDAAVADDDGDNTSGTYTAGGLDDNDLDRNTTDDDLDENGNAVDDIYETNAPIDKTP